MINMGLVIIGIGFVMGLFLLIRSQFSGSDKEVKYGVLILIITMLASAILNQK